jgi:hypothetical protein
MNVFFLASKNYSTSLILFKLEYYGFIIFIFRVKYVIFKIYVFLISCATKDENEVGKVQC